MLVFLFVFIPLKAKDCVPLALSGLSFIINEPVSYFYWYDRMLWDGVPPTAPEIISEWNNKFRTKPLVCIYSRFIPESIYSISTTRLAPPVGTGKPYLWVGIVPEFLVPTNGGAPGHAAIAYLYETHVELVSPLRPYMDTFFTEKISWNEFFLRTHALYELRSWTPIEYTKLLNN